MELVSKYLLGLLKKVHTHTHTNIRELDAHLYNKDLPLTQLSLQETDSSDKQVAKSCKLFKKTPRKLIY